MKKESIKKVYSQTYNFINKFVCLLLPIITCVIFLLICSNNDLYPFGNKSIAWCDMNQQFIPLLNSFKDVLEGKQSFTYNLANAGGMSLFSVYFFFLSSPFSYLVVFIEKAQLPNFVNLLVMFKLMVISLTMSYYLHKKYKNINILINIALSLFFTFSSYNLMYYQNIMWLDVVYMFPLLMLSIDYLLEKKRFIPYLICITTIVLLNYYLAFMVICVVIFYFGLNLIYRRKEEEIHRKARTFVFASLVGAMISCISVVPSFIQYLESARGTSLFESINNSWLISHYQTTIPLALCSISVIPFLFNKKMYTNRKIKYILLALLFIPLLIEPINCMWHIGSYQAFPCRFAFMFSFFVLDIVANNFDEEKEEKFLLKQIPGFLLSIILIGCLYFFEFNYVEKKIEDLDQYSHSLWGDSTSFEAISRYYIIVLIIVIGIYLLFKLKLLNKKLLSLSLVNLSIIEILFSTSIYLIPPSKDSSNYQELYSLQELINDESFYRVKMDYKLTDANVIGGAGFNSLGHYTSLTSENYMFTMKKLGYSSYWMEVSSNGGTIFTDALLQNKYTLHYGKKSNAVYTSDKYSFTENKVLPFGIVTTSDLSQYEELNNPSRVTMQETVYDALFNDNTDLHTTYEPTKLTNVSISKNDNRIKFTTSGDGSLTYKINIEGKQKLYFEAFDKYSNSLSEKINDQIVISCNNSSFSYPTKNNNGTVLLGTFKDTTVTVNIRIKNSIEVSSINVFSVNEELLTNQINNSVPNNLKVDAYGIKGQITTNSDSYLFLPISYFEGLNVKVNNKKVESLKVFSSFVAIKLTKGENNISITYSQPGLTLGIIIAILGISLLVTYFLLKNKVQFQHKKKIDKIIYYLTICLTLVTFILIYIFPLISNIVDKIK